MVQSSSSPLICLKGERQQSDAFKRSAETPEQVDDTTKFYENTKALIAKQLYNLVGGDAVNIVRDVFKVASIQ